MDLVVKIIADVRFCIWTDESEQKIGNPKWKARSMVTKVSSTSVLPTFNRSNPIRSKRQSYWRFRP